MSFALIEKALKGSPVEFYEFAMGNLYYRYTSADRDQTVNGYDYPSSKIKRSKIRIGGGMGGQSLTVTVPRSNELALLFVPIPPAKKIWLKVSERHRGDAETVVIWQGRVKNAEFKGAEVELLCESIMTAQRAQGLKRTFGANCPHALYDTTPLSCGVVKQNFETPASVATVAGNIITCTAAAMHADGYYAGGLLDWLTANGITETRTITKHIGDTLTLLAPINGLAVADSVKLYPGCLHTPGDCETKFNNLDNYGGCPYMPNSSPFGGTMLY